MPYKTGLPKSEKIDDHDHKKIISYNNSMKTGDNSNPKHKYVMQSSSRYHE